ncbi:MAG TPA: IS30 family transposase [Candidatus Binatia bacterium]|nr:IS30 family transposase [Candidatus Binatia bacterium]
MSYTQLTRGQRYQIKALMKEGHNQAQIATNVGCHKSTISRELSRNRGLKDYRPHQADELAFDRQCETYRSRIAWQTWQRVEQLLRQDWSPEQITGHLKREKQPSVSHEWIYLHVYADKRRGGTLHRHLRSQKKQRKRYSGYIRRGQIPNRTSIDKRPKIVANKGRFGDWEADTIIGARHKGGILSVVERKSKLTRLRKLHSKAAAEMRHTSISLLGPLAAQVHTITVDNGKEFCEHELIAKKLNTRIYFAHPYASWERGLNENTNGLVRQYFPKKYDFSKITNEELQRVEDLLNNRPRKTLGYRTPNQVFFKERSVALPS